MSECKHRKRLLLTEDGFLCQKLNGYFVFIEECEKCDGEGNWGKPTRLEKIIYFFMRWFK